MPNMYQYMYICVCDSCQLVSYSYAKRAWPQCHSTSWYGCSGSGFVFRYSFKSQSIAFVPLQHLGRNRRQLICIVLHKPHTSHCLEPVNRKCNFSPPEGSHMDREGKRGRRHSSLSLSLSVSIDNMLNHIHTYICTSSYFASSLVEDFAEFSLFIV